jgi:hypothetical protein
LRIQEQQEKKEKEKRDETYKKCLERKKVVENLEEEKRFREKYILEQKLHQFDVQFNHCK